MNEKGRSGKKNISRKWNSGVEEDELKMSGDSFDGGRPISISSGGRSGSSGRQGSGRAGAPDSEPLLTELFRRLSTLKQQYQFDIPLPVFALVGLQSAGKSTVMNLLLGFPAGFSQDGTGTRCPVMYFMEQADSKDDPIEVCLGRGRERLESWKSLHQRVESHMLRLQGQNIFSNEPFLVYVRSPDVINFVVVDLPGMIRTEDEDRDAVDNMIREALLRPMQYCNEFGHNLEVPEYNAIPIIISTFGDERENDTFLRLDGLIKDQRPNWRQEPTTMVLFNKVDEKLNFKLSKDFRDLQKKIIEDCAPMRVMFDCLCPPNANIGPIARLSPGEYRKYLGEVPGLEKEWFEETVRAMCDEPEVDGRVRQDLLNILETRCGFEHFKNAVVETMTKKVKTCVSIVGDMLKSQEDRMVMELGELNSAIQNNSPAFFRDRFSEIMSTFLLEMKKLFNEGPVRLTEHCKIGFEKEMGILQGRWANGDREFVEFCQSFELAADDLRRLFEEERYPEEREDMEEELAGVAQFDRLHTAWRAMVSVMQPLKLLRRQKRAKKGGHLSSLKGEYTDQLRNVLQEILKHLKLACRYLCEMMRHFFDYCADRVCDYLAQTEYAFRDGTDSDIQEDDPLNVKFLKAVRDDFKAVVNRAIDDIVLSYRDDTRYSLVDLELPEFMLSVATKLESVVRLGNLELIQFARMTNPAGILDEEARSNMSLPVYPAGDDADVHLRDKYESKAPEEGDRVGSNRQDGAFDKMLPFGGARHSGVRRLFENFSGQLESMAKRMAFGSDRTLRSVDMFNARMKKKVHIDLHDNEKHVDMDASIHLVIQQFLFLDNVESRVRRVWDVVNQSDKDRFLERGMKKGLFQINVECAISELMKRGGDSSMRMHRAEFENDVEGLLAKYFPTKAKRMELMSDDEVLERYRARDQADLEEKRDVLQAQLAEFRVHQKAILRSLRDLKSEAPEVALGIRNGNNHVKNLNVSDTAVDFEDARADVEDGYGQGSRVDFM